MNSPLSNDPIEILIAEDNPEDAELATRALRSENLADRIFIVHDGEEALDFVFSRGKFEERKLLKLPKVVFLDLKLPKVSGLEVLREMKTQLKTRATPVVIITSSNEETDIRAAYEFGANGYVVKPVEFEAFSYTLTQTGLFWLSLNEEPR